MSTVTITREGWPRCYRVVSSRFPPVGLFDAIAEADELEAVYYYDAMANPRLRHEIGELEMVAPEDRIAGPGTTPIMAAFTHVSPRGSRFSDGHLGVYYGTRQVDTAIAETVYHAERENRLLNTPPIILLNRVYVGALTERSYHDLRGQQDTYAAVYNRDPGSYGAGQALARDLRQQGSWGLLYDSVRHPGGECVAAFRPAALAPVHQSRHLAYVWDGRQIADVQVVRSLGVPAH